MKQTAEDQEIEDLVYNTLLALSIFNKMRKNPKYARSIQQMFLDYFKSNDCPDMMPTGMIEWGMLIGMFQTMCNSNTIPEARGMLELHIAPEVVEFIKDWHKNNP